MDHRLAVHVVLVYMIGLFHTTTGTVYMDDHCGDTIQHIGDRMYSQYSRYYDNNMDCRTTLKAATGYQRISIDFDWIDIESTLYGCPDYLEVYDGPNMTSPLLKRLCGRFEPVDILSSGQYLMLRLKTDMNRVDNGFNLVFTSFYDRQNSPHTCNGTDQYRCDSIRCIDSSLQCDGRDNCGDKSDEKDCSSGWVSVWSIFFIAIGILIVATCGLMCICACCAYCLTACQKQSTNVVTSSSTVVTETVDPTQDMEFQTTNDSTDTSLPDTNTSLPQPPPYAYYLPPPSYNAAFSYEEDDSLPPKPDTF